jgi:hypothetical protein
MVALYVIPPLVDAVKWRGAAGLACAAACAACWIAALVMRPSVAGARPRLSPTVLWLAGFAGGAAAVTLLT